MHLLSSANKKKEEEEVSQDLEKVGGAFWERVTAKKEGALGLIPERARGPGMTRAELDTREVEGDHTAPRAVEGFQLPPFPCPLWLRLCF